MVHPYCNGINKDELNKLGMTEEHWYCEKCNITIFPNHLLKNTKEKIIIKKHKLELAHEFETHDDCSVCLKKVTGTETLSCTSCKHWVHKKCIGVFNDRTEYQNFLKYYFSKEWECPTCRSQQLPFIFMDNSEFILLLLDIFTKPTYLNKDNFEQIYQNLNNKDFFNMSDTETDNHRHNKYLDGIDPDINYYCNDICNYTINIDKITNCKDELTIMNFNIRSIKKNFSNLEHLLSGLNCKLHIIYV